MDDSGTTRRPLRVRSRRRARPRRRLRDAAALLAERAADVAESASADGRGPYEDCYDVRRGYAVERVIVRP